MWGYKMTILNKLMFWKKSEQKMQDGSDKIEALVPPPYLINKDYIKFNPEKGSFVINKEIIIFAYRGNR